MRTEGEVGMIRIDLDMDMPEECHECPFQLKFKDDEVDAWYMRRCVIMHRKIEYPRPEWCPLKEQENEYEKGFNDAMIGKQDLMYEGVDGKWHKKDW
jgi:hypothetical protein